MNLALVTAPPEDCEITAASFSVTQLYAVLPVTHLAARNEYVELQNLANDDWILFARRVHPVIYDAIIQAGQRRGIGPRNAHEIITMQPAVHLVSERIGVAILNRPPVLGFGSDDLVAKPISDSALYFEECLVLRSDDDTKLVNEFARSFLRQYAHLRRAPRQLELALSA